MKIALTIPGPDGQPITIDSGLPVPTGGLAANGDKMGAGQSTIVTLVIFVVLIAIFFALWSIMKGSWNLIQSTGHKEKIQRARERILYALWGIIMIVIALLLLKAFSTFLRYDLLCIILQPYSACKL